VGFFQAEKMTSMIESSKVDFYKQFVVIKRVSDQMEGVVEDLVDTSTNVKQAAEFIAAGTAQQTVDVEKCIGLTDDFTASIDSMEQKSIELISLANDMTDVHKNGKSSIENLSLNQEKNQKVIGELVNQIYSVLEKTKMIGKITDILHNLSEQTYLLSFNAKIEAANAGQYGKSFTAVANEIRKLSEESKSASQNINGTIENITNELNVLKNTVDTSIGVFTNQGKSVDSVIDAFNKINHYTETFIDEHKNFTEQVSEIKIQKDELVDSMSQIFTGIQKSTATTEEVASLAMSQNASTAILSKLSTDLDNQVNKIGNGLDQNKIEEFSTDKKKVSVIFDLDDPFWEPTRREAIKAAKAFNVDIDFFAPKSRSTGSSEMESRLVQIINEKRDALIISPIDDPKIEEKLKKINAAGTKIVFINSKIDSIKYESLIETNGIIAGKYAAKVTKKYLNNDGEVIVGLWSDEHISSIDNRAKGFIEELRATSNIIVHEVSVKSEPSFEEAEKTIDKMLEQYPGTKLIFSTNIGWGLLYAKYMKKHKPNLKVITMDFTKDVESAIKEGSISSAIAQRAFSWGTTSLNFLDKIFQGKPVQKYVDTGTYEVNLSNIKIYEGRV
jgi:methyl-accepting chemotaxis protein/ABC-type sugar transport system substrate-binding protein